VGRGVGAGVQNGERLHQNSAGRGGLDAGGIGAAGRKDVDAREVRDNDASLLTQRSNHHLQLVEASACVLIMH